MCSSDLAWYRRSVDAVSREEYEMLARAIGRADQQAADQAALVATLQSQPRLQRVTPWAVADLEQREAAGVLFVYGYHLQIASYNSSRGWWWSGSIGGQVGRPSRGWFIELSKLKEVQQ